MSLFPRLRRPPDEVPAEIITPDLVRLILGEPVERVPSGDSVLVLSKGVVTGTYPVVHKEPV